LDTLCTSTCYDIMVTAIKDLSVCTANALKSIPGLNMTLSGSSFDMAPFLEFMCTKNLAGDYCLVLMPRNTNISDHTCGPFLTGGCCGVSFFNVFASIYDSIFSAFGANSSSSALLSQCGLAGAAPCPRPGAALKYVSAVWHIDGISFGWYAENEKNKQQLISHLKTDIASNLDCPESYITITSITEGSIVVAFQLLADNDADTEALGTKAQTVISSGSATFPALSDLPPAANDSGSAPTLNPVGSHSTVETTDDSKDSGAFATASASLGVVAMIAFNL